MEAETRRLVARIAAYRVLGWTSQAIAKALRCSKSNVCRILQTDECLAEIARIHERKVAALESSLTTGGLVAVRRLKRFGRRATEDDARAIQANGMLLAAAVRALGYRQWKDEPKSGANQVVFVDIRSSESLPALPSGSPAEPPAESPSAPPPEPPA